MFDLDHMLNGKGSREHLQNAILESQRTKFAREAKPSPPNNKFTAPFRAVLVAFINLIVK